MCWSFFLIKLQGCRLLNRVHLDPKYWFGDHKYWFWILQIITFLADIGYLLEPLSNHTWSPENLENISNFQG